MSDTSIGSSPGKIDWSAITTAVECPLCLYNLRGLVDPRCPECGCEFEWPDLLDPQRPKHRYLFEHQPRRNFWSWGRTLLGGLRTRKFWTDLKPTHAIHLRRLLIYWLLCSCLVLVAPVVEIGRAAMLQAISSGSVRANSPLAIKGQYTPQSRQNYMDRHFPLPPDPRFFRIVQTRIGWWLIAEAAISAAPILMWPWLTFAALMIFQISMRRRGVRPIHVLRCVIYCADLSTWYFVLSLLAMMGMMVYATARAGKVSWMLQERVGAWLVFGLWVLRLDRLWTAYRKYLHFDHPFWTALASQLIVVLSGGVLLFWGARLAAWASR